MRFVLLDIIVLLELMILPYILAQEDIIVQHKHQTQFNALQECLMISHMENQLVIASNAQWVINVQLDSLIEAIFVVWDISVQLAHTRLNTHAQLVHILDIEQD